MCTFIKCLHGFGFQSYKRRNSFLMTQMPLPNTVVDLWRLVFDHRCPTIITLDEGDEEVIVLGEILASVVCVMTVRMA